MSELAVGRFRKKPVVIEATQWDASVRDATRIIDWVLSGGGTARYHDEGDDPFIAIDTLEGTMHTAPFDWVLRGVHGEFYPCKPNIFDATYDPIIGGEQP